jgi:hypothetical protein
MKYTSTSGLHLTERLVNEYGNFLGQTNWTFYCTLSTTYPLSVKSAQRCIERTHEQLQTNYNLKTQIYWVAEPFDSNYGFHLHCLVKFDSNEPYKHKKELIKAWEIVTKGSYGKKYNWTSIAPYDSNLGGRYYVVKWISRNDIEYGFL